MHDNKNGSGSSFDSKNKKGAIKIQFKNTITNATQFANSNSNGNQRKVPSQYFDNTKNVDSAKKGNYFHDRQVDLVKNWRNTSNTESVEGNKTELPKQETSNNSNNSNEPIARSNSNEPIARSNSNEPIARSNNSNNNTSASFTQKGTTLLRKDYFDKSGKRANSLERYQRDRVSSGTSTGGASNNNQNKPQGTTGGGRFFYNNTSGGTGGTNTNRTQQGTTGGYTGGYTGNNANNNNSKFKGHYHNRNNSNNNKPSHGSRQKSRSINDVVRNNRNSLHNPAAIDLNNQEIDDVLGNVINVVAPNSISSIYANRIKRVRMSSSSNVSREDSGKSIIRTIIIPNAGITLSDLANQMSIKIGELMKHLMKMQIMATANQLLDHDTAQLIAEEYGHRVSFANDNLEENFINNLILDEDDNKNLQPRAPIVTIMGHVDHGKTSLLDSIRATSVVDKEAGGITQHIGAYMINHNGHNITFLDTPGHAAFIEMRARGAKVTDIVVIVVAADDGIMPQTIEAISHAKKEKAPIIVAINKIDKPEANIEATKRMLLQYDLLPEELGGDVMVVPISAKTGANIDKLLEAILLQAEVLELTASYETDKKSAVVIESKLDKGRGPVATIIVQQGTIKVGDIFVVGTTSGKIRTLNDENGKKIISAFPSMPVEITGLSAVPEAGEHLYVAENEDEINDLIKYRQNAIKDQASSQHGKRLSKASINALFNSNNKKVLNIILKCDVKGSLEAINSTLTAFNYEEVELKILSSGIGFISESDVSMAKITDAIIVGFNVDAENSNVRNILHRDNIYFAKYDIIYNLIDGIKDLMSKKLDPIIEEKEEGTAVVKAIYNFKSNKIVGCYVKTGTIARNSIARVYDGSKLLYETKIVAVKKNKDDVKEAAAGHECGIGLDLNNSIDIKVDSVIKTFKKIETYKKLK